MKITLIGSIKKENQLSSGQHIRTFILYNELVRTYGEKNVTLINTNNYKWNFIVLILKLVLSIFKSKKYIVMLSSNGRKAFIPILVFYKFFFNKDIYHNIIGGSYTDFLTNNPKFISYTKYFNLNWIQTEDQLLEMNKIGIENVQLLPNVKKYTNKITNSTLYDVSKNVFMFCTFSRINEEKGIKNAILSTIRLNESKTSMKIILKMYGIIDDNFKEELMSYIDKYEYIIYGGLIKFDEPINVLKNYYCLLFPSVHVGEGFPGTLLDALFSGIPTIASNWRHNSQIIKHGYNGLLFDINDENGLYDMMLYSINNTEEMNQMRINALKESTRYDFDFVMSKMFEELKKY